jgi:hypothetical protein
MLTDDHLITEMIIEKGTLVIQKAKKSPFYLGLSKNKNELTLLNPYPSNNKNKLKKFRKSFRPMKSRETKYGRLTS